jgi:cell division protein YceG involved in septum cleavage
VLARRAILVVLLVGALAGAAWAGASLVRDEAPPAPPPVAQPKILRIIFPEGFTRRDMADRVDAVHDIAIAKRGVTPRLTRTGYLNATAAARPPAEFRKDWPGDRIEGFLFPATYEFTRLTPATRLVRDQLAHFRRQWRKVDLRYARSMRRARPRAFGRT